MIRAVIHGRRATVIEAPGNSPSTPYVRSIRVDGTPYPSQFISGERLADRNTTIRFGMTAAPARIGRMYLTGTGGEVLSASTDGRSYLRFGNEPLGGTSQARIYTVAGPASVTVNGIALPGRDWSYHPGAHVLDLSGLPAGRVVIRFRPA